MTTKTIFPHHRKLARIMERSLKVIIGTHEKIDHRALVKDLYHELCRAREDLSWFKYQTSKPLVELADNLKEMQEKYDWACQHCKALREQNHSLQDLIAEVETEAEAEYQKAG